MAEDSGSDASYTHGTSSYEGSFNYGPASNEKSLQLSINQIIQEEPEQDEDSARESRFSQDSVAGVPSRSSQYGSKRTSYLKRPLTTIAE